MAASRVCPYCGLLNHPQRQTCHQCHQSLSDTPPRLSDTLLPVDERQRILDDEIAMRAHDGWRAVVRTETTAQLIRDRQSNGCAALVLLCLGILPGVLYLMATRGQESLYIDVDPYGRIQRIAR
jgi:hypothetical protein